MSIDRTWGPNEIFDHLDKLEKRIEHLEKEVKNLDPGWDSEPPPPFPPPPPED